MSMYLVRFARERIFLVPEAAEKLATPHALGSQLKLDGASVVVEVDESTNDERIIRAAFESLSAEHPELPLHLKWE